MNREQATRVVRLLDKLIKANLQVVVSIKSTEQIYNELRVIEDKLENALMGEPE